MYILPIYKITLLSYITTEKYHWDTNTEIKDPGQRIKNCNKVVPRFSRGFETGKDRSEQVSDGRPLSSRCDGIRPDCKKTRKYKLMSMDKKTIELLFRSILDWYFQKKE